MIIFIFIDLIFLSDKCLLIINLHLEKVELRQLVNILYKWAYKGLSKDPYGLVNRNKHGPVDGK